MNTEAIELICEKLGTTIEYLVPAVIEYLTHRANVGIAVGVVLVVVGAFLVTIGFVIDKHEYGFGWFLAGGFVLGFGMIVLGFYFYARHLVIAYPQISAYKEILGWIKGGG